MPGVAPRRCWHRIGRLRTVWELFELIFFSPYYIICLPLVLSLGWSTRISTTWNIDCNCQKTFWASMWTHGLWADCSVLGHLPLLKDRTLLRHHWNSQLYSASQKSCPLPCTTSYLTDVFDWNSECAAGGASQLLVSLCTGPNHRRVRPRSLSWECHYTTWYLGEGSTTRTGHNLVEGGMDRCGRGIEGTAKGKDEIARGSQQHAAPIPATSGFDDQSQTTKHRYTSTVSRDGERTDGRAPSNCRISEDIFDAQLHAAGTTWGSTRQQSRFSWCFGQLPVNSASGGRKGAVLCRQAASSKGLARTAK